MKACCSRPILQAPLVTLVMPKIKLTSVKEILVVNGTKFITYKHGITVCFAALSGNFSNYYHFFFFISNARSDKKLKSILNVFTLSLHYYVNRSFGK